MSHITVIYQDVTLSHYMIKSHDEYGRVVYRLYSSCISSIQNPMETLLSSPCQLGFGV